MYKFTVIIFTDRIKFGAGLEAGRERLFGRGAKALQKNVESTQHPAPATVLPVGMQPLSDTNRFFEVVQNSLDARR